MSVVINGVTCLELVADLEEGIREGGPTAQKKYLCAWGNRYQLANGMMGLVSGSGVGGAITITAPTQYPESPNLWAREISIKGVGQPSQGVKQLQFPSAVVTVGYGVPQWSPIPLPQMSLDPTQPLVYATQEMDFGEQTILIPPSALKFSGGGTFNTNLPYPITLPLVTMTITLHRVPYLNAAAYITATQNPLNNATFLGCGAGYLRFKGARTHQEASTDGTVVQEVTLVFVYRPTLRWDETLNYDGISGPTQVQYNGAAIPGLGRSNLSTLIPSAYL